MPQLWSAIGVTFLASTGNNVGKVLQKDATRHLPRFAFHAKTAQQYLASRAWMLGLGLDVAGALLMIAAYAMAPVSIVQPVSGLGLGTVAVFSHFYLKERLAAGEWGAVALALLGTLLLGASAEDQAAEQQLRGSFTRLALVVALMVAFLGAVSAARRRIIKGQKRRHAAAAKASAALFGLQAGACFGMSAACCRLGFNLARSSTWVAAPVGLLVGVGFTSLGFVLQTLGLKDGNTVVVCTCASVSSIGTGVVVGVLGLQEPMPSTLSLQALRLLSWLLILLGIAALATGQSGVLEVIRAVLRSLPQTLQAKLPPALAKHARSRSMAGLPVFDDADVDLHDMNSKSIN
ncbi:hypothetical protein WJX73_006607 [Symbiochloris irregularis]|uniref:Probable magnesium transporter n=1 Tax=Symbiochloris irregularis TaxID=706552 RepID=A0AAW1NQ62_9CHLO